MKPTLATLLEDRAQRTPDRLALHLYRSDGWTRWSWGQYRQQAQAAAAGLRARGVHAGDPILLVEVSGPSAVATLFGAWTLGAVPVSIGLPYRLQFLDGFLAQLRALAKRLGARSLVLPQAFSNLAPTDAGGLALIEAETLLEATPEEIAPDSVDARQLALLQLTSGSTSHPRAVELPHDRILLHLQSITEAMPAHQRSVAVSWLPLHHDMGLMGGLLYPFYNGFPLHLLTPLDFRNSPWLWLKTMSDVKATITPGPPSGYALLLRLSRRAAENALDLSSLETAMIGAEPISASLLRSFAEAFAPVRFRPNAWFPVYGLAEATVAVTFPRPGSPVVVDSVDRLTLEREGLAVSTAASTDSVSFVGVGQPLPRTEIRIVDTEGQTVPERVVGEIEVRSETLMTGYYAEPETTAAAFRGDWLRTGDLGYQAKGSLFVTGRAKELIIKAGRNYIPSVLEDIAASVEGVRAGCVIAAGIRSEALQTELIGLVAETKVPPEEHGVLEGRLREAFEVRGITVDHIVLVAPGSLPKTTSGKLKRVEVALTLARQNRVER